MTSVNLSSTVPVRLLLPHQEVGPGQVLAEAGVNLSRGVPFRHAR